MKRAKAKTIDFFNHEQDFACVYYAGIGLSYSCIEELTGFTRGQIDKRLRKAGIGVKSYRNGNTPIAKFIIKSNRAIAEKHIMRQLLQ